MRILILGGTGAMGAPLTGYLSEDKDNDIYVVSRHPHTSSVKNVHYVCGDINRRIFFENLLSKGYDVIVDFMIWTPKILRQRRGLLLNSCQQYIGMGTSAEYSNAEIVTEETPLLIDSYSPEVCKQTFRYHIKKSRDVALITKTSHTNWTIVRPCVTFSSGKNKLVTVPANVWLWRCRQNKTIILPEGVKDKKCPTMYADDAAYCISKLVGNPKAMGQIVNLAPDIQPTWGEVVEIYQEILWEKLGKVMKIYWLSDASLLWKDIPSQYDPLLHDRFFDRYFSNEKLREICGGDVRFGDLRENLEKCIDQMLRDPMFNMPPPNPEVNAWMDRIAGENSPMYIYTGAFKKRYKRMRSRFMAKGVRVARYIKNKNVRYIYQQPSTDEGVPVGTCKETKPEEDVQDVCGEDNAS